MRNDLKRIYVNAPSKPGVYIMKDAKSNILYVGKSVNLNSRLAAYFARKQKNDAKTTVLLQKVKGLEYILTDTDQEAILLECQLIKRYKPRYNVRLKDDKNYPYIKIDINEPYPLVYITRKIVNDGAAYYGPYANAASVRKTLSLLKRLFPYRSCTKKITGNDERACLDFHINRCIAPCTGVGTKDEYTEVINQVKMFLDGKRDEVLLSLSQSMIAAASTLEFEKAAKFRDQINAITQLNEEQKILHFSNSDIDFISIANSERESWAEVFYVRDGNITGRNGYAVDGTYMTNKSDVIEAFIEQYYTVSHKAPKHILVEAYPDKTKDLESWLAERFGKAIKIRVPQKGTRKKIMNLVAKNASKGLTELIIKSANHNRQNLVLSELQEELELPRLPNRIECYDISNIHGTNPVGSMIVFNEGKAIKSEYRKFTIKNVDKIDDYLMMKEVLFRRFSNYKYSTKSHKSTIAASKWSQRPDLVLIDGGRGHLSVAVQVLLELGVDDIPLASIAKENEELYTPQIKGPILLARSSQALYLIQRIRDEAHRFAITFHRNKRSKSMLASRLDSIVGIGPRKKMQLMSKFGSLKGISEAGIHELTTVTGISKELAIVIKQSI